MAGDHERLVSDDALSELDMPDVEAWRDFLSRSGAIGDAAFGVQYDLNAAWRETGGQTIGASFCDHNCTTELGSYTCLAASTLNIGVKRATLAPAEVILQSFSTLEEGVEAARTDFFAHSFQTYCENFHIPPEVAVAMRTSLDKPGLEVNLFGGNPELHPDVTAIIRELRDDGHVVHLTTTGGRFMRDANFLREIQEYPPTLIALSADDFDSPADIHHLAGLSLGDIRAEWSKIPAKHGQRRKAHEAVYVAKLAQTTDTFPPILFNMVLHGGNITDAEGIITALTEEFPGVLVNPFPAQSAFSYSSEPILRAEHAQPLQAFVDHMIETQITSVRAGESTYPYVPRLHYWLMLRAVFDWAGGDSEKAMNMITGDGIWQCYRDSPAGFYLQVGLGPDGQDRSTHTQNAGGCLGCFWNRQTVTKNEQIWDESVTPQTVSSYIQVGKSALAAASSQACPGCAFPRLVRDEISAETGMDPRLVPYYLNRRAETFRF